MKIGVIYGGTRDHGNTEMLTDVAIKDLPVERFYLRDYTVLPIEDQRHSQKGFKKINDDYNYIIDQVLQQDILIFATPIYWFSMSATMKLFIDRWSQTLKDPTYPHFKNSMSAKKAYVMAVGGDNPLLKGLPLIQQFQYIFEFIGISFEGYVLGKGNKPEDIIQDEDAIVAANQMHQTLREQLTI